MYTQNNRPRPHVSIPAGARAPTNPSPSARAFSPFSVEVTPPAYEDSPLANPWDSIQNSSYSPDTPRTRTQSMYSSYPGNSNASISFPEPMIYRSTSARASLQPTPTLTHRHSRSDVGHSASAIRLHRDPSSISVASVAASSYYHNDASDSDRDQYAEVLRHLLRHDKLLIIILSLRMMSLTSLASFPASRACLFRSAL